MLYSILQLAVIAQLPMAQAGQLLFVIGVAFVVIVLISSSYRFHQMIQLDESELPTPEDCNDFFFIQVTRYLSKINRVSTGFSVLVIQFRTHEIDTRIVQEALLVALRNVVREVSDKVCLFSNDSVAVIVDTETENTSAVVARLIKDIKTAADKVSAIDAFRVGISSFPLNGLNTQRIIDAAIEAMEQSAFDAPEPYRIAVSEEEKPVDNNASHDVGEISREDKNAALDPLTGVLRPEVVGSYCRKYIFEVRRKRQPLTLLCVGISRIDQVIELSGEAAADVVIAGVSAVLQRLTRQGDLIGRYHRDDFMVLCPCTLKQGEKIATRLREAVQKEVFLSNGRRIKTSVSIGITAMPEHGRNLRDLFSGAYRALEVVRGWNTTACLVYDPAQHAKKKENETRR